MSVLLKKNSHLSESLNQGVMRNCFLFVMHYPKKITFATNAYTF